jgi:hypothetical protein
MFQKSSQAERFSLTRRHGGYDWCAGMPGAGAFLRRESQTGLRERAVGANSFAKAVFQVIEMNEFDGPIRE